MDSYRQQQARKWKQQQDIVPQARTEDSISIVAVDATSLDSIKEFLAVGDRFRSGVLFGAIADDGFTVVVDAIYETAQDATSGEVLIDKRLPMVRRISKMMGLNPVGILSPSGMCKANDLLTVVRLEGAVSHVVLSVTGDTVEAIMPTTLCFSHVESGILKADTTLNGFTVDGGLDGKSLQRGLAVVRRVTNTVVHTGFYRMNRSNHTPTLNDAKAFIVSRRDKAGVVQLHLQLADYHLLLFIADSLGESAAERAILSIFQEEDELVEDLIELLMTSSDDL